MYLLLLLKLLFFIPSSKDPGVNKEQTKFYKIGSPVQRKAL